MPKAGSVTALAMLPDPTHADILKVMETNLGMWDGEMLNGPMHVDLQILMDIKAFRAAIVPAAEPQRREEKATAGSLSAQGGPKLKGTRQ